MTSNAQLAALLSESYREIEELKRRTCPSRDELRACLTALDDVRARIVRLLGDETHHHHHAHTASGSSSSTYGLGAMTTTSNGNGNGLKRARTSTDDSHSASPPQAKKPTITIRPSTSTAASTSIAHQATLPAPTPTPVPRAAPAPVPMPVPGKVYPATNELGQRICRTCGQPGRYKENKCVEKWGPGPLGPGTVCDRCRKKIKRVERRATAKPVVPQLARNNLPAALLSPSRSTPTYSPEPLEDLLMKAHEGRERAHHDPFGDDADGDGDDDQDGEDQNQPHHGGGGAGGHGGGGGYGGLGKGGYPGANGGGGERDELMSDADGEAEEDVEVEMEMDDIKEELVDDLLDAVDASEGR